MAMARRLPRSELIGSRSIRNSVGHKSPKHLISTMQHWRGLAEQETTEQA
jgi:hypothetical protein